MLFRKLLKIGLVMVILLAIITVMSAYVVVEIPMYDIYTYENGSVLVLGTSEVYIEEEQRIYSFNITDPYCQGYLKLLRQYPVYLPEQIKRTCTTGNR